MCRTSCLTWSLLGTRQLARKNVSRFRCLLGSLIASVMLCGVTLAQAGSPHDCQGRCGYCVDGVCTPKRATYGYYQPHWRRWPVEAPIAIPMSPPEGATAEGLSEGDRVDLPTPEEEAEITPEFEYLRRRPTGNAEPGGSRDDAPDPFRDDERPEDAALLIPGAGQPELESRTVSAPEMAQPRSLPILSSARPLVMNPLRTGAAPPVPVKQERVTIPVGYNQIDPPNRLPPVAKPRLGRSARGSLRNPLR